MTAKGNGIFVFFRRDICFFHLKASWGLSFMEEGLPHGSLKGMKAAK